MPKIQFHVALPDGLEGAEREQKIDADIGRLVSELLSYVPKERWRQIDVERGEQRLPSCFLLTYV